ncbi:MAG: methyltransferase domain-containing protein [Bellilinea sp.]
MDWHARYTQQAGWTAQTRRYLYEKAGLAKAARVLEPGCGTGAVLADCPASALHGLDWDAQHLQVAHRTVPRAHLVRADAVTLPYATASFDACLTHYFLLWVDAVRVLAEMRRVTRPGGVILALAEPDYGARIDSPAELALIGQLQGQALENQGADPCMGRKLAALFTGAGLQQVASGVMGGEWSARQFEDDGGDLEWAALEADLAGSLPPERLAELRRIDAAAWQHGKRILFVPTFYAIGWVPG